MYKKSTLIAALFLLASCSGTKYATTNKNTTTPKTNKTVVKTPTTPTTKKTSTAETLEATSTTTVTSDMVIGYINQFKETAKDNMRTYGIPASITLAQGILESGSGQGRLAREANNHFGIKCHSGWTGETIHHDDDAAQECFRKYRHASESYRDHSLFLTSRSRYASLFKLDKGDYRAWAQGLRQAGYATDVKYPDKLISLIDRYQLYQYDDEVLGVKSQKNTTSVAAAATKPNVKADSTAVQHRVEKGDTLYSISKKYNTTVDAIKKLNNLSDASLSIGQLLKIK